MKSYLSRRQHILDTIGKDGVAILFAAPEQRRSNDTEFPFRQDSYFHYLSGFPEPEAVIVLDGAAHVYKLWPITKIGQKIGHNEPACQNVGTAVALCRCFP